MASAQTASYSGRYAKLTVVEQSYSVENNTSTLRWDLDVVGGSVNYYNAYEIKCTVAGQVVYGPVSKTYDTQAFPAAKGNRNGTLTIQHNPDGSASDITFTIRGSYYNNNPADHSNTLSLTTIPRASDPTLPTGVTRVTLGNNVRITTNRHSDSFTHTIRIKDGSTILQEFNNVGAYYDWTPPVDSTVSNRHIYANQILTASKTFTIECETFSNGNSIGTKAISVILDVPTGSSYNPTCGLTVSAINNDCPNAWGSRYVQYKSKVNVSVTFTGKYGSEFSYRSSSVQDMGSSSESSWTTGALSSSGSKSISASVTDSRGNTGTASTSINVIPYFSPRITRALAERNDNTLNITYSYEIASVDNANAHAFVIEYKKASQTWAQATTLVNNTTDLSLSNQTASASNLDASSSYDVRFTITDSTGSNSQYASVGTAFKLMNFNSSGLAMAIGKISEASSNEKLFEVGMNQKNIGNIELNGVQTINTPNSIHGSLICQAGNTNEASIRYRAYNTDHEVVAGYSTSGVDGWGVWSNGCDNMFTLNWADGSAWIRGHLDVANYIYTPSDIYCSGCLCTYNKAGLVCLDNYIPGDPSSSWQSTVFGRTGNSMIKACRTTGTYGGFRAWGPSIAAAVDDVHMIISADYGSANVTIGAGYQYNTLAWTRELGFKQDLPYGSISGNTGWVRFPNCGLQICWDQTGYSGDGITVTANAVTTRDFTFPIAFSQVPTINPFLNSGSASQTVGYISVSAWNASTSGFTLRAFSKDSSNRKPHAGYIAIGTFW